MENLIKVRRNCDRVQYHSHLCLGVHPSGRKAKWTAAGFFKLENGKIIRFIKEWDKLSMWKQLGFPLEEATTSLPVARPSLMIASLETIRRYLHAHAELSDQEKSTAASIVGWLQEVGAKRIITGLGGYGVAGVFSGRETGPRVMLRAELDALPISERGDERAWRSQNEHVAHSCGHDGHMAILLGIAKRLADTPPIRGEIILLFQPAEETGDGARAVVESKEFDASLRSDVAYALHNQPGRPFGEISIREGAFACASRGMIVRLHGRCSHAAHPEQGVSPVHVMCQLLKELEQLPERLPSSEDLRLVTIVHAQLGEVAFGTTPGEAVIMATLRTATDALMQPLVEAARELIERATQDAGLTYDIEFRDVFAAVLNDQQATKDVIHCAEKCGKKLKLLQAPNRWSEDFGVYSTVCRSAMFLLGAGEKMHVLHDSAYDFPDALIDHGVEMFWALLNEQRLFDD
jgi:amidohydrolase